jgi:hypothetical protein
MHRRLLTVIAIGIAVATVTGRAASGAGGPDPGVRQGWDGIASADFRYVTISAGSWTSVAKIKRNGGRVVNYLNIKGSWGIPAVSYDGATGGLTHDGAKLVLGQVRTAQGLLKQSSFTLIGTKQLRKLRTVRLAGDLAFDALSPDGRYLYLVEHLSARDLASYRVRAYDFRTNKLLADPVIDRREWETTMQGLPMTRLLSRDGAWVYTLYGGGKHPFIHALDTRHVEAVCIDLPKSWNRIDLSGLRMRWTQDGRIGVRYVSGGRALATVDAEKLRVLSLVRIP